MNALKWLNYEYIKLEDAAREFEKRGEKVIKIGPKPENDWFVTRRRPYAIEFLTALNNLGQTFVLTSGRTGFQTEVVNMHKLPVRGVYGKDRYGSVKQSPQAILIDDNWNLQSMGIEAKVGAIGCGTDRVVVVKVWMGDDPADNGLMEILPKIKTLLAK
jgi:hypothetical protein